MSIPTLCLCVGLGNLAGLTSTDGGMVHGSEAVFLSASVGTALGALTGITPLIITAESAVGSAVMTL